MARLTDGLRTYSELIQIPDIRDRYSYCRLQGTVGQSTFGFDRLFNQAFYKNSPWKNIRDRVIDRDNGCEFGVPGFTINGPIYVHHMNPIDVSDLLNETEYLLNPDYLICVSKRMHDAIHYGDKIPWGYVIEERRPNDTCPWR